MATKIHRRVACALVILGLFHAHSAVSAKVPPPLHGLAHVWFGAFTNTQPNGKVSHDVTALAGGVGPAMDRLAPLLNGHTDGRMMTFRIEGGGGIVFALRLSHDHLVGTAKGSRVNAVLDLTPAPGLMPSEQLLSEIMAADARVFAAFDSCNAKQYGAGLSPALEFYQDNQPAKNKQEILNSLNYRCAEGIKLRRDLDKSSLIINAAPPNYAIEAGVQRIWSQQADGSETLEATVRFTMVWSKESGAWQLLRVVSYDHTPSARPIAKWATLVVTADVNRDADLTWSRIGGHDYCAIKNYIETQSCVLNNGTGEVGTVRVMNGDLQELLVARTPYSYTYTQPTATNFYHATLAVEPVDSTHSRIVYTTLYDQGGADANAVAKDREARRLRFQNAVNRMKVAAEASP